MSKDADGLTVKRRAFVEAYLGEAKGNASEAYRLAGYKVASDKVASVEGWRLLGIPSVSRAITLRQAEIAKETGVTPETVVAGLKRETIPTEERGQASARVRAWELLGKIQGLFTDRVEITDGGQAEKIAAYEDALAREIGLEEAEAVGVGEGDATDGA